MSLSPAPPTYEELLREREELKAANSVLAEANAALMALVESQQTKIAELEAKIEELMRRLNQNSQNSSRPPSSDGFRRSPGRKRQKQSGRKPGKQPGAPGATLAQVDNPDRVFEFMPTECRRCGGSLVGAEPVGSERRQVRDIPEPKGMEVDEYRSVSLCCAECGEATKAEFPAGVVAPVEYGPRTRALAVYMVVYQHVAYERVREWFKDCYGEDISVGTLVAMVAEAGVRLELPEKEIRELLKKAPVVHLDETGGRVNGKLHWVHAATTLGLTLLKIHARRGKQGTASLGVLDGFEGVIQHDNWAPYRDWELEHALCNAHHLRELQGVSEMGRQGWATRMGELLREIHQEVERAKATGLPVLPPEMLQEFKERYQAEIEQGYRTNPIPKRKRRWGKAGNLVGRLDQHRAEVLRFMYDFRVPFDNNQAERDLRMVKLQQKISGCWRSEAGAQAYLRARSYISTARKQGQDVLAVLTSVFQDSPWLPFALSDGCSLP